MFREGVVEAAVDQEVPEIGMMYPMHQHCEIARVMIAVRLPGACRIEVQTGVHVDNSSLQGRDGNVTRMRQHIAPVREHGSRNRIRFGLESAESSTQQV